ncbi:transposable element Tc1 transposase [Trichonephila clavipes]|nr:transposable element Tc1 transposase [Trichonephila clavipes]
MADRAKFALVPTITTPACTLSSLITVLLGSISWNHAVWGRIVFSNESRFQLCPEDHRSHVWRRLGQCANPDFTIAHHTGPQPRVMVWGAI